MALKLTVLATTVLMTLSGTAHAANEGGSGDGPDAQAASVVAEPTPEPEPAYTPREYLFAHYASLAHRLDCMIAHESTWNPLARNGTHQGLAQFDLPTWLETPQGKAGLSRLDPIASIDGMAWGVTHLGFGRWTTARLC